MKRNSLPDVLTNREEASITYTRIVPPNSHGLFLNSFSFGRFIWFIFISSISVIFSFWWIFMKIRYYRLLLNGRSFSRLLWLSLLGDINQTRWCEISTLSRRYSRLRRIIFWKYLQNILIIFIYVYIVIL